MSVKLKIGIDVGGTFTDVVGIDEFGKLTVVKTLTTPGDFAAGVITGIKKLLKHANADNKSVDIIIHGTTVGTNALLERKGVKTGLLTTDGFRDVLEIGRVQRPEEGLYDFNVDNPAPLIPRRYRLEAIERVDSKGNLIVPLDENSVVKAAEVFKKEGISAIAVCFVFSFLNPEHEQRAKKILERELPDTFVSISSDIAPEFREFERTSTVAINSYIGPLIDNYVSKLEGRILSEFPNASLKLIQANGGSMRASAATGRAANLINSGPAGGATAASFLGRHIDVPHIIATDMGGTSFDISLIEKGAGNVTTDSKFEGFPIKVPMCEVTAIGAGGGSIAWIDSGGALNVGPQSAAASPGPACYNFGGKLPTVTDSNLVLGRINSNLLLGGEIKPSKLAAEEAIAKVVADKLGMTIEEAAWSVIRIINAKMAKAITVRSTQKGYDLREFSLVPFGGAGPLHAAEIAAELGIPRIIIPPYPGAFSATGLLIADTRYDFVRAFYREQAETSPENLWGAFINLTASAERELDSDQVDIKNRKILWSADLRFEGQSYELNIPVGENIHKNKDRFARSDVERICSDFSDTHEKIYAIKSLAEKIYFVNLRVTGIGSSKQFKPFELAEGSPSASTAVKEQRNVYFGKWLCSDIYDRQLLKSGNLINGPAVIEENNSCTVIPPACSARIDRMGNIIISI
ncbi:MAG: hydantoinase/oxoprolinase family protein [Planctomycetes bacterium]|nr:hydantoinase/oxoprolinase family protein [Planctomycetota bacterium]